MEAWQRARVGLNIDARVAGIPGNRLGVQIHCLRSHVAHDFAGTLLRIRSLGIEAVELCHFPGFAGNPWGDFGELARWPAREVGAVLTETGVHCVATHCTRRDLTDENFQRTIAWALEAGSPAIVLAGFPATGDSSPRSWAEKFEWLNVTGRRLLEEGLAFAYHTQNGVWQTVHGALLANEMFRIVNPAWCRIELDPSGALVYGTDWTMSVLQHPNRYLALHLRDGRRPRNPVPYLPAVPLGEGDTDWRRTFDVATDVGIPYYLLEMEVEDQTQAFAAIETSIDYLNALDALSSLERTKP
jgi:sugar phosphate isomerase/epimerase